MRRWRAAIGDSVALGKHGSDAAVLDQVPLECRLGLTKGSRAGGNHLWNKLPGVFPWRCQSTSVLSAS